MKTPSTLTVLHAASLWYPIMLAEAHGEISVAKAAELLSMSLSEYEREKANAIQSVIDFIGKLPSPLNSLVEAIAARPELFNPSRPSSNSTTTEN